ncbi:MAG TPA: 4'-phosphopantetheinyl transferase superfamily protein [Acidimicrobiales bacterium]|nr:4'-phosphopantetheinyl transferase superfamily protein [Acidimicrobiales bacterium]
MSTLEAVVAEQLRLAAGTNGEVTGIGIDYEPWRESADLRTSRFFLRPTEQAHATDARSLLRLWTVKEALFKATPDNGNAVLLDYEIAEPASRSGWATGPRGDLMRYVSVELDHGLLSVALCRQGPG